MNLQKRILVSFLAFLLSLVALELTFRFSYPLYANYNTEMWRYASILKRRSNFPELLGHEHRPNRVADLYGAHVTTNSQGFRADRDYNIQKPKNGFRILSLGDSITFGWGVRQEETYPALLEKKLAEKTIRPVEVLNTGVGNYNVVNELAALKKNLIYRPDLITLGFYINDIESIAYPSPFTQLLMTHSYAYGYLSDRLINMKYGATGAYQHHYTTLYNDPFHRSRLLQALTEMADIAYREKIPLLFLNIPEFHQFKPYPFIEIHEWISKTVAQLPSVDYLDALPLLEKYPPKSLWVSPEDHHPNEAGQRILATAIYNRIKEAHYDEIPHERSVLIP